MILLSLYHSSYHSHFSYIIVIIIPTWPEAVASNPSSLAQGRCVESNCPPSRRMNQPNCPPSRRMNQPTGQRPLRRIRVPWPGAVASNPRTLARRRCVGSEYDATNCPPSRKMSQPIGPRPLRRIRIPWPEAVASCSDCGCFNANTTAAYPGQRPCSDCGASMRPQQRPTLARGRAPTVGASRPEAVHQQSVFMSLCVIVRFRIHGASHTTSPSLESPSGTKRASSCHSG